MKKKGGASYGALLYDVLRWVIAAAVSVAVVFVLQTVYNLAGEKGIAYTINVPAPEEEGAAPAAAQIAYQHVEAPEASRENGVVTAQEWAAVYPEIVASYEANAENSYRVSYLEEDPYLINIYEGYGFAKDYTSAIAHNYTLEDVAKTERPHPLANCLTCKTADFTALVNQQGASAYSLEFDAVYPDMSENVGCYTCHENQAGDAGKLVVTHDYTIASLGDDMANISPATLACGQCHIEYYFDPETKATGAPYSGVASMNPDDMLAYYNEMGFADWTQESTGAKLLKAQHPEFETFMGEGSRHASMGLSCADCHMETVTSDSGVVYSSHSLVSPLASEGILATCVQCHGETDMAEKVHAIQESVTARETEIGNALSDLNDKLTDAVASGNYSEDQLEEIRDKYRSAQWYFDFVYVENSEGAHNSTLANSCLDKAEGFIEEALALI